MQTVTVYLDCNATAPLCPEASSVLMHWFAEEIGNAGSRTHEFGVRASKAVQKAREQVACVVSADVDEIHFTSGATESNNIALLGLAAHGERTRRKHLISSFIEHKAVLEPLELLRSRGFEVSLVPVGSTGAVSVADIAEVLRPDTLAVSVMHVNNETGVEQPVSGIARVLEGHDAYFHPVRATACSTTPCEWMKS